jgi:hypothetical protein
MSNAQYHDFGTNAKQGWLASEPIATFSTSELIYSYTLSVSLSKRQIISPFELLILSAFGVC